ncbi:MAG: helix-turn-helix domain-containing protein [bacterium]
MARTIAEILTPEAGRKLREAREARSLSVADVAAKLRLNPHFIESMEAGDLRPLPPDPYRKAFISEYVKFLGLKLDSLSPEIPVPEREGLISSAVSAVPDVAKKVTQSAVRTTESAFKIVEEGVKDAVEEITSRDLWQEANEVRNERLGKRDPVSDETRIQVRRKTVAPSTPEEPSTIEEETEATVPRESRRSRRVAITETPNTDTYSDDYIKDNDDSDDHPGLSRATKTIVGLLVVIASIVGYSIFTKKSNAPQSIAEPEPKQVIKTEAAKPKPIIQPKKDSVLTAAIVPTSSDSLIFTITANDSVWVSVSPDVGKGFRGKLAKGETKTFSAKDKYFLFLGNLKSVRMTLDGKPVTNVPTIAGSSMVVRNAILERGKISVAPSEKPKAHPHMGKKKVAKPIPIKATHKVAPKKKKPQKAPYTNPTISPAKPLLPQ